MSSESSIKLPDSEEFSLTANSSTLADMDAKEDLGEEIFETAKIDKPLPKGYVLTDKELKNIISEFAYYQAEKRGFEAGFEEQDWVESEKAVLKKFTQMGIEKIEGE